MALPTLAAHSEWNRHPLIRPGYFSTIREQLDQPRIEFLDGINDREKCEFLSSAAALLFPIDWTEPFGQVMIEAMECGTLVIGSVAEVIEDGVNGFIVESIEEAVEAVERIPSIDRRQCRAIFEKRFSARRMCNDYLRVYERVIEECEEISGPELDHAAVA